MAQPQESGQIRDVVGMKMAYGDQRQVAKLCLGLAKAKEGAATHVDKHPRLSADPKQITRRRAISIDPGSTRTEDLHSYWICLTALSRCVGWNCEKSEQAHNPGSIHQ